MKLGRIFIKLETSNHFTARRLLSQGFGIFLKFSSQFVLLLVSSVSGYNIKINPIAKTAVTNSKNTGELEKTNYFTVCYPNI